MAIVLSKYNEIIEKLGKTCNEFEKMCIYANTDYMHLANGDDIRIKFPKNGLAHLLGVKTDYLQQANRFKKDATTYDKLRSFIEDGYAFSKLVKEGKLNFDSMFSKYIEEKLECYKDNMRIRIDDIEFIIKHDSEKTYQTLDNIDICNYYIVRKKDNNFYVLGLVAGEENVYLPATSRLYKNKEEFNQFMNVVARKQEITYATQMKITNYINDFSEMFYIKEDDKLDMINKLLSYSEKYQATPSLAVDYFYNLSKSIKRRNTDIGVKRVMDMLSQSINKGNVLDSETIKNILDNEELNDSLKSLIDTCNNAMCNQTDNSNAINNYAELEQQNKNIKEELLQYKEQLNQLQQQNQLLETQVSELTAENKTQQEIIAIYDNAQEKVKALRQK